MPWLFIVALSVSLVAAQTMAQNPVEVENQDGIAYVSGGIGADERNYLDEMSSRFTLKITMALQEGNYLSDVSLRIYDDRGRQLLQTIAKGPWFFADLPAGQYVISAESTGRNLTKKVLVDTTVQTQVLFAW